MADVTRARWAHPRSRGENWPCASSDSLAAGSSPLTRGKRAHADRLSPPLRLIPAHAGKTGESAPDAGAAWAHPRSRGENSASTSAREATTGSSPLTRGKHLLTRQRDVLEGLIPAHAGKTPQTWRGGQSGRAHPRSRGENGSHAAALTRVRGSSPLTRGKRPSWR